MKKEFVLLFFTGLIISTVHQVKAEDNGGIDIVEPGLFSQKEEMELSQLWSSYLEKQGIRFSVLIHSVNSHEPERSKQKSMIQKVNSDTIGRQVLFILNHEKKDMRLVYTSNLQAVLGGEFEKDLIDDVLMPNFKRGWWKFGFEEASKRIVRKLNNKGEESFQWSNVLLWAMIIGIPLLAYRGLFRKSSVLITSGGVEKRSNLRNTKAAENQEEEKRKFKGGGSSFEW